MSTVLKALLAVITAIVSAIVAYCLAVYVDTYVSAPRIVRRHVATLQTRLRPSDLSAEQRKILLAVEDPRFFSHHGIDLSTPGAGLTTMTQGLIKFLYFKKFTPGFVNKIDQSLMALAFDCRIGKNTQLALFLNSVYLGNNFGEQVHGFAEGARAYYGKEVRDLGRDEFTSLVAMAIAPNEYNVANNFKKNSERVSRINKLVDGKCAPAGVSDVYYERCK